MVSIQEPDGYLYEVLSFVMTTIKLNLCFYVALFFQEL